MPEYDTFSLIGHPPNIDLLHKYVQFLKPEYKNNRMDDNLLYTMYHWMPPFKAFEINTKHPYTSNDVNGLFVLATFLPEMLIKYRESAVNKVKEAVKLSESLGAKTIALGGFTSIIDGQQGKIVAESAKSAKVTNGSTMTTALTVQGVENISDILNINISDSTIAIVGATGSIGKTCADYFKDKAGYLVLTGRDQAKLDSCFFNWDSDEQLNIELTTDNKYAVGIADIVICVTSSIHSLFTPFDFKTGAVVCDVGFPKTVSVDCADRKDIVTFMGGLAQMPWGFDEAVVWGLNSRKVVYGCFTEAMLIALEGCYEYCSVGLDFINIDNVKAMINIAHKHGFKLAPFANSKRIYTEDDFKRIRLIREGKHFEVIVT